MVSFFIKFEYSIFPFEIVFEIHPYVGRVREELSPYCYDGMLYFAVRPKSLGEKTYFHIKMSPNPTLPTICIKGTWSSAAAVEAEDDDTNLLNITQGVDPINFIRHRHNAASTVPGMFLLELNFTY
jgi:hypothetical protein